jgi:hypothetical protein
MLPFLPPAEVVQVSMPTHTWGTLQEARRAASRSGLTLAVLVPEDQTRYDAVLAILRSVDGAKVRGLAEFWLPRPGDPDASKLMDELGLRSLPAFATLSGSGKRALVTLLGDECVPVSTALSKLVEPAPVPQAWLQDWIGKGTPIEPFLAFARDRKRSLDAAAKEPHRTWLVNLMRGKDVNLRNWAATRLVEANTEGTAYPVLLDQLKARFKREVQQGNQGKDWVANNGRNGSEAPSFSGKADPPVADLGRSGIIDEKAPVWLAIRQRLRHDPSLKLNVGLYTLLAPALQAADKDWILALLAREADVLPRVKAQYSPLYWLATDWLLAFGRPGDWEGFISSMAPMGWDGKLRSLMNTMKEVPCYWNSEPDLQSMYSDGECQETFWEHPDTCLASWGVTREMLVEFGIERMKSKGNPMAPAYPPEARSLSLSTNLHIRMLVGPDGILKWARPEPGYALSFFAPTGLAYAMKWRFEPARVAGVPRPSQFHLTIPFTLR